MLQIQCCAPDDGWGIHPKHVEQFTEIKICVTLDLVGHTLEYICDVRNPKRQIYSQEGDLFAIPESHLVIRLEVTKL